MIFSRPFCYRFVKRVDGLGDVMAAHRGRVGHGPALHVGERVEQGLDLGAEVAQESEVYEHFDRTGAVHGWDSASGRGAQLVLSGAS